MSEDEILEGIRILSKSMGTYSRLYQWLQAARSAGSEAYHEFMDTILAKEPKDIVDVVLILEG